jgi:hypothetical protein
MKIRIVLALVLFATPLLAESKTPHELAFERMKALAGEWKGKSTRGWEERMTWRVIAGGSAVLVTSFDAHPNETMATLFHLDGGKLMLTHYCVAKNQPRLVATDISEDGRRMVFTFRDATGIASRDAGHMDKAVYELVDDRRFTSQWTWYAKGKEQWMEKIECERAD